MQYMQIKHNLQQLGIPVMEEDIPYIRYMLRLIQEVHTPLEAEHDLYKEVPLVVVDPEVVQFD